MPDYSAGMRAVRRQPFLSRMYLLLEMHNALYLCALPHCYTSFHPWDPAARWPIMAAGMRKRSEKGFYLHIQGRRSIGAKRRVPADHKTWLLIFYMHLGDYRDKEIPLIIAR